MNPVALLLAVDAGDRNTAIIVAAIGAAAIVISAIVGILNRGTTHQSDEQHQSNTGHLLELRHGQDLMLTHQEHQDRTLRELRETTATIKAEAMKIDARTNRVEDHILRQEEALYEIRSASHLASDRLDAVEKALHDHIGWASKVMLEIEAHTGVDLSKYHHRGEPI